MQYSKYGEVAIEATRHIQETGESPGNAWNKFAEEIFDNETSSARDKGCPRNAYLGLCEDGLVDGVPEGNYVEKRKGKKANKSYAIQAVHMLRSNPSLENLRPKNLWDRVMEVMEDGPDNHNNQMDVVLALWHEDMIVKA